MVKATHDKHDPDQDAGYNAMREALMATMRNNRPSPEAQKEAMRTVSEAAKGAASVDKEHMAATGKTAEARWGAAAEFAKMAESVEERRHYFDEACNADNRESEERRDTGERSTNTQHGIAKIGAYVGMGAAVLGVGVLAVSSAYASSKLMDTGK
jgi:hypothetical protein